jgi:hypothetical protein
MLLRSLAVISLRIPWVPDRQKETAAAWMKKHPEITHVSRDRGKDYAAAANGRQTLP